MHVESSRGSVTSRMTRYHYWHVYAVYEERSGNALSELSTRDQACKDTLSPFFDFDTRCIVPIALRRGTLDAIL